MEKATERYLVTQITEMQRDKVVAKEDYSKKVRNKIDNVSKRKKFKKEQFSGKKTCKDPYTENILHEDIKAAQNKYGKKCYTKHTLDVDHNIPLEQVYNQLKDNPFLTNEDIKNIANIEANYTATNSNTNRAKGSQSNLEFIQNQEDKNNVLSRQQKEKMVNRQKYSQQQINIEATKTTIRNANEIGMEGAKNAIIVEGVISSARHTQMVINKEEDVSEAIIQVGVDMVKEGASNYCKTISEQVVDGMLKTASREMMGKEMSKQLAKGIEKFTNSGGSATIVNFLFETGITTKKYIDGEITGEEFVVELGEKGTGMVASLAGGEVGCIVGGLAGAIIGTAICPGVGTGIGTEVGLIVGEIVGNLIGYVVGTKVYRTIQEKLGCDENKQKKQMYEELTKQLKQYRTALNYSIESAHFQFEKEIKEAFEFMQEAIIQNDINNINLSLSQICKQFDTEIRFATFEEFDSFMLDSNVSVKLGTRR